MDPGIFVGRATAWLTNPRMAVTLPGAMTYPPFHTALVSDNSRSASAACSSPFSTLVWLLSHVYCTRLLAARTIPVPGNCVIFIPMNSGMENVRDSRAPGKWEPKNANPNGK